MTSSDNPTTPNLLKVSNPGPFTQLMMEAFMLLGRYFVVIYPIFLYFILRSLLSPKALPDYQHWAWWVVSVGFIAIWFLFEAGWHAMTFQAVQLYETQRTQTIPENPSEIPPEIVFPFALLRAFIPGIGEYGLRFLVGGFLNIMLFALPAAAMIWLGIQTIGIPHLILPFLNTPEFQTQQFEKAFLAASAPEQMQLLLWEGIFWAILLLTLLVTNLTMYWRPYVIMHQFSPPRAFLKSVRFIFKHPLLTIQILFLSVALGLLAALTSLSTWTALFGFFLMILIMLYLQFILYLVLYRADGPQQIT